MTETKTIEPSVKKAISFHYHPYNFEKGEHAVEKADKDGKKRRYICGISSGSKFDRHEERMTEKCIHSFNEQANSGDILLYPDIHGIQASKDIGILTKSEIMEDGNWYTEFRLYDESDDVDQDSIDTAGKIWKQVRGEAPYNKPRQKGFSVEGYIPPGGIIAASNQGGKISKRIMDAVELDGVILVPRPAYQDSIATAVYKALGEMNPDKSDHVRKDIQTTFSQVLKSQEAGGEFWKKKAALNEALDETIEAIMGTNDETARERLDLAYEEYSDMMVELIISTPNLFEEKSEETDADPGPYGKPEPVIKQHLNGAVMKAISSYAVSAPKPSVQKPPNPGVIKAINTAVQKSKNRRIQK